MLSNKLKKIDIEQRLLLLNRKVILLKDILIYEIRDNYLEIHPDGADDRYFADFDELFVAVNDELSKLEDHLEQELFENYVNLYEQSPEGVE